MKNETIHNILSLEEIEFLIDNPQVKANKEKLSDNIKIIDFSIPLTNDIIIKLENLLLIDLSQSSCVPMRWIRGDTNTHIDSGKLQFTNTYLIYLTSTIGELIVDGKHSPIIAGDAHIFSEGLEHSTINTENSERLMIGPMSETGFSVGLPNRIYYRPSSIANISISPYDDTYGAGFYYESYNYPLTTTILNIPPPTPTDPSDPDININYWNNTGISDSIVWAPPNGKIFGGWKLMDIDGNSPIDNNDFSKIYIPGETYSFFNFTWLVPNWINDPSSINIVYQKPSFTMHFTDNSLVYYKPNSLSTGGGGSGVRNSRHKQRRT